MCDFVQFPWNFTGGRCCSVFGATADRHGGLFHNCIALFPAWQTLVKVGMLCWKGLQHFMSKSRSKSRMTMENARLCYQVKFCLRYPNNVAQSISTDTVTTYATTSNGAACTRFCRTDDGGDIVCKKCSKFWRWNGLHHLETTLLWLHWCEDTMLQNPERLYTFTCKGIAGTGRHKDAYPVIEGMDLVVYQCPGVPPTSLM